MKAPLLVKDLRIRRSPDFTLAIDSLRLRAGDIVCVTGPNGSGKTTLIDCLVGLLKPDQGEVLVAGEAVGHDLRHIRAHLGYIPDDESWFIKELSAYEYFRLLAKVYRDAGITSDTLARATQLAETLYFTAFHQKLANLSHGNKKKVQLIAGMMHEPRVLIVDELRNGLDPLAIIAAEKLIKSVAKRGTCVVAATHDLWWAERIAKHIVLFLNGSPALQANKRNVVQQYGSLEACFLSIVKGKP